MSDLTPAQPASPAGWYTQGYQQRWWDGTQWTEHYAPLPQAQGQMAPGLVVVPRNYKTSHGFHLVMSIITLGLWLPVWLIVGLYNSSHAPY